MRKFKYLFSNRINKKLHKQRIEHLETEAKRKFKVNSLFYKVFGVLYWTMMIIILLIMIILQQQIEAIIGATFFVILITLVILPAWIFICSINKIKKNIRVNH